jgi:hypothetical protein
MLIHKSFINPSSTFSVVLLMFISIILSSCLTPSSEDLLSYDQNKAFKASIELLNDHDVLITLNPAYQGGDVYYSLSFHQCDEVVIAPEKIPDEAQKDKSITLLLKENKASKLALLFYKSSVTTAVDGKEINFNPFIEKDPITDIRGKLFGTTVKGIGRFVVSGSGKGVILTAKGEGPISYVTDIGYQFIVRFKEKPYLKILVGILRFNFLNPGLNYPLVASACTSLPADKSL